MAEELVFQIALSLISNIGDVYAKELIDTFGSAGEVFKAKHKHLESVEGLGPVRVRSILEFKDFKRAEEEIAFLKKYHITPLFITDKNYPERLLNCYDPPVLLYYKGSADLNNKRVLSVVGTRKNSEYGKSICEKLIEDLQNEDVLIVSGLAFGIDTIAHKASLKYNLPTVGVVAHGLDRLYPSENKSLAKQMIGMGGILTDFRSGTNPDKQNFPRRNRIVAGMCDAVLVIESGIKGGSLITAELGNSYNREVFAFPGKVTESRSEGCNYLIKNNKAALVTGSKDILNNMGWVEKTKTIKKQKELFIDLSEDEKIIMDIVQSEEQMHIDQIYQLSKLNSSAVASALLTLEMNGLVLSLPGKIYKQA